MKKVVIIVLVIVIVALLGVSGWYLVNSLQKEKNKTEELENKIAVLEKESVNIQTGKNELTTENSISKNQQDKTNNTDKNNNTSNQSNDKKYVDEYIKIIEQVQKESSNSEVSFDLIYFNNDNIPDLVTSGLSVYVYKDGKVHTVIENEVTGTGSVKYFDYYEKKSTAVSFGTGEAGLVCGETFYLFNQNYKNDIYSYSVKGADATDEEQKKNQDEALNSYGGYWHEGTKISEEQFINKLKEYGINFSTEKLWNDKTTERKELNPTKTAEEVKNQLKSLS